MHFYNAACCVSLTIPSNVDQPLSYAAQQPLHLIFGPNILILISLLHIPLIPSLKEDDSTPLNNDNSI